MPTLITVAKQIKKINADTVVSRNIPMASENEFNGNVLGSSYTPAFAVVA